MVYFDISTSFCKIFVSAFARFTQIPIPILGEFFIVFSLFLLLIATCECTKNDCKIERDIVMLPVPWLECDSPITIKPKISNYVPDVHCCFTYYFFDRVCFGTSFSRRSVQSIGSAKHTDIPTYTQKIRHFVKSDILILSTYLKHF